MTAPDRMLRRRVEAGLRACLDGLGGELPAVAFDGSLSRPTLALGVARKLGGEASLPAGFWPAALAIQLAHEASLVHDDIVDHAAVRRGRASHAARHGVEAAVLHGDHLLTTAYRAAAATGSAPFMAMFADGLARMVAAESSHRRSGDRPLSDTEYVAMVAGKTGELLGCALAAAPVLRGDGRAPELLGLGRRTGVVYQRVDDLLDYCPAAPTGKPRFGDHENRRWTWVLGVADLPPESDRRRLRERLFLPPGGTSPMRRALAVVREEADAVRADLRRLVGPLRALEEVLAGWTGAAERAVAAEEAALSTNAARPREEDDGVLQATDGPRAVGAA